MKECLSEVKQIEVDGIVSSMCEERARLTDREEHKNEEQLTSLTISRNGRQLKLIDDGDWYYVPIQ